MLIQTTIGLETRQRIVNGCLFMLLLYRRQLQIHNVIFVCLLRLLYPERYCANVLIKNTIWLLCHWISLTFGTFSWLDGTWLGNSLFAISWLRLLNIVFNHFFLFRFGWHLLFGNFILRNEKSSCRLFMLFRLNLSLAIPFLSVIRV